jgi:ADP-ribose pyrophosphatase YjhB (NUDIX family)
MSNNTETIQNDIMSVNKLWKKKDCIYCNNCGKYGHTYKKCFDPITSYGIICFKITNKKLYNFLMLKYKFPLEMKQLKNICINKYIEKNISCNNKKDLDIFNNKVSKDTNYLMVRRKHTFNYIYIIRGLYELDLESLIKNINLMTHEEYYKINNYKFEDLWLDIWGSEIKPCEIMTYQKAEEQFNFLKSYILPQIIHKINISYNYPEWGFPKGRKNETETNLDCAKREFTEETGLTDNDFIILDRLYPLTENIIGSNGVSYRYIYYIGLLNCDIESNKIKNGSIDNNLEIGDIGLYNVYDIDNVIRDYNSDRKNLINNIKLFLTYNNRYLEKFYHETKL